MKWSAIIQVSVSARCTSCPHLSQDLVYFCTICMTFNRCDVAETFSTSIGLNRRTDNTVIYSTLHRKLKIEQH